MMLMYNADNEEFYTYCRNYDYVRALESGIAKGIITEKDRSLISEYIHERKVTANLSKVRCNKISGCLINFRRFMSVEYHACTISDIFSGLDKLQVGLSVKGKPLSDNTKKDYIIITKPFLLWLIDNEYNLLPVKKIKLIKAPKVDLMTTSPDEILTVEEIENMIGEAMNSRDRALISLIYESGARVAEVGRLRWKDLIFDEDGLRLYIDDKKTKKHRYVRISIYTQYIATWKQDTPRNSPNDPVFIDLNKFVIIRYDAIVRVLQRLGKRAGITKKVNPHIFRHSRITHMIQQNYQESIVKKSMWNNINTYMFAVYVSLSENDIDSEFLSKSGVKSKRKKESSVKPIPCGQCHYTNAPKSKFCAKCGYPLTDEADAEVNNRISEAINYIEGNPDFREFYKEYQNFLNAKKDFQALKAE